MSKEPVRRLDWFRRRRRRVDQTAITTKTVLDALVDIFMQDKPLIERLIAHRLVDVINRILTDAGLTAIAPKYSEGQLVGFEEDTVCAVPPAGWRCTRVAGHDGPCAAIPREDNEHE